MHFKMTGKRYLFLLFLILWAFLYYFEAHTFPLLLKEKLKFFQKWASIHEPFAVILYILLFITLVASTVPCATILTLLGGFLFGISAVFYALISIVTGGILLCFLVRHSNHLFFLKKIQGIKRFENKIKQHAFLYLLLLRLVPVFPCWISNIGAGFFKIPLRIFITASLLGILPSTLLYVLAGKNLDILLQHSFSLTYLFDQSSFFFIFLALFTFTLILIAFSLKKVTK